MKEDNNEQKLHNRGYSHLFSGAGIGLLVGTLIGMSLSPVVGGVIAGLTALLAAFLGLSDKKIPGTDRAVSNETDSTQQFREYRAGSFGFACTVGVLLGLFIRANNLLGVSLQDHYQNWVEIGFSKTEARQLLVYKEFGILPDGSTNDRSDINRRPDLSVLYTGRLETCRNLAPERYSNTSEILSAWNLQRSGHWRTLATQIEDLVSTDQQKAIIESVWRLACEQEE